MEARGTSLISEEIRQDPDDLSCLVERVKTYARNSSLKYAARRPKLVKPAVAHRNPFLDLFASLVIILGTMQNADSLLAVCNGFGAVLFYFFVPASQSLEKWGSNMSWTFVSFVIVFPLVLNIQEAFRRRELALVELSRVKAYSSQIFASFMLWNWDSNGRQKLPKHFEMAARCTLMVMLSNMEKYLRAPTIRSRHKVTSCGQADARVFLEQQSQYHTSVMRAYKRITVLVEVLKSEGLSAGEASRINQYLSIIGVAFARLRSIKDYRTPAVTCSYGQIYIQWLPWLYGPYYLYLAGAGNTGGAGIYFAVTFAVVTQMAFVGLFSAMNSLEDSFVASPFAHIDNIDVEQEFGEVYDEMDIISQNESWDPNLDPTEDPKFYSDFAELIS
eukprot:GEMP01020744.1.p1 GENE.GEMP01020744.1~~GEMP01020744.1.p1  ORF type:complete len:388 (+),score=56.87 GEMP01020744.1:345-1508(+)